MSSRQAKRARVAALQSGDPVAAQARAEGNRVRALEMRRAREAAANRVAAEERSAARHFANNHALRSPLPLREDDRLDVPPADEPYLPLKGLAVSGRGGGGRLSRLALIPLLLAGLEAEERRQR